MVKKIFVGIVITAVFGALILGGVNRALAKNDFSRTNAGDPVLLNDNADAPSGIHEEKQNEFLAANQNGECDGLNEDPLCNQEQEMVQEQHQYKYQNEYKYTTQQGPEGGNSGENAKGNGQGNDPLYPIVPANGSGGQSDHTGNGKGAGQKGVH